MPYPLPMCARRSRAAGALMMLVAGALASLSAWGHSPADPRGRWITANGNLEIEIAPCGAALCGRVTRVLGNRSMLGGEGEGEAMRPVDARPALGLQLLSDFRPLDEIDAEGNRQPPRTWSGRLYDRESGRTYRCALRVDGAEPAGGGLVLRAYVGLPLFGKTLRWSRAPVDSTATAASAAP